MHKIVTVPLSAYSTLYHASLVDKPSGEERQTSNQASKLTSNDSIHVIVAIGIEGKTEETKE